MLRGLTFIFLILLTPAFAQAHSMYQSSVLLDIHRGSVDIELQVPPSRLGGSLGIVLTIENLGTESKQVLDYFHARFIVVDPDGTLWSMSSMSAPEWKIIDDAPYIVTHLSARAPNVRNARHFHVTDRIITERLRSHAVLVMVRSDWEGNTFANEPNLIGVITGNEPALDVDLGPGNWAKGFGSLFHLGIRHIAEGTDHLLFLLALLLPAPRGHLPRRWTGRIGVRQSVLQVIKIATAFTLGHSITLALAALGVVHTPERPIEVLIAASILVSAIHGLRPLFPGREMVVAAGFGLIHGLAFAATLSDLGLRGWERLQGILAFNLGIETMQLVVIAGVMPSLLLLSRTRFYSVLRIFGAAFAIVVSCGWIIERASGHSLGVDGLVEMIAGRSVWLASVLFCVSTALYLLNRSDIKGSAVR